MWCVTSVAFLLILVQICHFQNKASTVAPYQTYMDTVCLCFFTGIGELLERKRRKLGVCLYKRQNPILPPAWQFCSLCFQFNLFWFLLVYKCFWLLFLFIGFNSLSVNEEGASKALRRRRGSKIQEEFMAAFPTFWAGKPFLNRFIV